MKRSTYRQAPPAPPGPWPLLTAMVTASILLALVSVLVAEAAW